MRVVCIDDKSSLPSIWFNTPSKKIINYDNSIFGNLTIGNIYTVTLVKGDNNYYYVEELKKFIPTNLFVKIEDMRDNKINSILNG